MSTLPGMEPPEPEGCSRDCEGGFVPVAEGPEAGTVYPCPHCRPALFREWASDPKRFGWRDEDTARRQRGEATRKLPRSIRTTAPRRLNEDS